MIGIFPKKNKGMTLIETLMAVFIFFLGIEGFTLLFINSWKNNSFVLEMGQASMAASQGINKMVGYIREVRMADNGAYPVKSADDNDLVVYSDFDDDGQVERLHFYLSGGNLIMGIREPTPSFPVSYAVGDGETRIVARSVVNDPITEPVFAYYDASYPEDSINNPVSTPATAPNVRLVRITLHVNIDPHRAPDNIKIQSFAEMRNLNDHDRYGT